MILCMINDGEILTNLSISLYLLLGTTRVFFFSIPSRMADATRSADTAIFGLGSDPAKEERLLWYQPSWIDYAEYKLKKPMNVKR